MTYYINAKEFNYMATDKIKIQITEQNQAPDSQNDKWEFVKCLKTTTDNIPWLVKSGDNYYVALLANVYRLGYVIYLYNSNPKGEYDFTSGKEINKLVMGVSIEHACNTFFN